MYTIMFPLHLLSSNHKSTHPCCKPTQKMEMIWTSLMKISTRGLRCPGRLPMGFVCSVAARRESRYSLRCKDNNHVIKFI
jgi:hypothetical protein